MTDRKSNRRGFFTGKSVGQSLPSSDEQATSGNIYDHAAKPPTASDTLRLTARAMACEFSVIMNAGEQAAIWQASEALDRVGQLEDILSVYRSESETSRLNRSHSEWVPVSRDLFDILRLSVELSQQTGGCFDVTTEPLIQLWRRCREEHRVPSREEVDDSRRAIGMEQIELDDSRQSVRLENAECSVNFGAIGKGYAIDQVSLRVKSQGQHDYLLHGGRSSLLAMGNHTGCEGWPVGIGNPLLTNQRLGTLLLRNQALATSGSNIQFFRIGNRRYGHILDPRTGWPASGAVSLTVLAPSAALADALSTAFYVMQPDQIAECCSANPEIGVIRVPFSTGERLVQPQLFGKIPSGLFWEPGQVREPATDS